jgi:hypothetical protein
MPESATPAAADLKAVVLQVLDENRTMAMATLREDGWPQTTLVGFVHDDLTLYCIVSRQSQKLRNIRRDPRVSIAIGRHAAPGGAVRGLSMAARVEEVTQFHEIERLNALAHARDPKLVIFAPRDSNAAVLRVRPEVVSLVDEARGVVQPVLLDARQRTELSPTSGGPS